MNRTFLTFSLATGLMFPGCGPKPLVQRPALPPAAPSDGIPGLESGLQKNEDRLDLRLRLVELYQEKDDFEAAYALWARTLQMADRPSHRFIWENGGPPPHRVSQLLSHRLQGSIDHALDRDTEEGTDRALRLSKLGATYFPGRRSFERSRALCYSRRGDPEAAVRCLLRLLQKDPEDVATLRMMADLLEKGGKEKEAGIYRGKAERLSGPAREGEERNGVILTY